MTPPRPRLSLAAVVALALALPLPGAGADGELRKALRPLIYNCSLALSDVGELEAAVSSAGLLADLPDADDNELYLAGALCIKAGRYLKGKAYLERLLSRTPAHADALKYLVTAEAGAYQEALANVRQALAAADYPAAMNALATARTLQPESPQLLELTDQTRRVGLATAREQEMKAQVARNRAQVTLAEAEVPLAMAAAFRQGNLEGTAKGKA